MFTKNDIIKRKDNVVILRKKDKANRTRYYKGQLDSSDLRIRHIKLTTKSYMNIF